MVKREVKIMAQLLLGVITLEMVIGGGVPHVDADIQVGEAPPTAGAGPFLEIGEERDHCPGISLEGMKGNRRPVCKSSGVQGINSSDRNM